MTMRNESDEMGWRLSWRADPQARAIADRHYNRQSIGARDIAPPGRCLVLLATTGPALWITSWPFAEYVKHAWAGAWVCSAFRNEGAGLSSSLIRQAVAATRWRYGEPPDLGMITFIDETKVRHKRDPGRCFRRAGFAVVGRTKTRNLVALQLLSAEMPPPMAPIGSQTEIFGTYSE